MISPFEGTEFVIMWLAFLLLMSSGIAVFFLWAVRHGQFANQERARYLPLSARIPTEEEEEERRKAEQGRRQP